MFANIIVHLTNSVYVFIVVLTEAKPIRFKHFYAALCWMVAFTLFSLIYYWCGGKNRQGEDWIYPFLDWSNPGATLGYAPVFMIVLLIGHSAVYGLYKLRMRWYHSNNEGEKTGIASETV